jgi:Ras-related protein Rab-1A
VKAKEIAAMYKIIMIGDSDTGKTSLLLRFCEGKFDSTQNCTIGIDFKLKNVKIDKKIIKLQLWDTAGQERFKSMSNNYIRNAHGCIAVYDISKRDSFLNLEKQIVDFMSYTGSKIQT